MRLTNAKHVGMFASDTSLLEEGNERLVGGLDQHELEGVAIESNALQRFEDGVEKSAASD